MRLKSLGTDDRFIGRRVVEWEAPERKRKEESSGVVDSVDTLHNQIDTKTGEAKKGNTLKVEGFLTLDMRVTEVVTLRVSSIN